MYLKSLKLVGFKSFADRTRIELRPGVTVVVGPNGSGKSNLVDAVAWVMGTQSVKALRTGKMDDVVFAGTATRPSLGRAEVTLVLDNASGMLPLDLPEVSITRRLYRDGSSDYEINGVACRLLDVQELLSDSGVGRRQHVIVGQGQIDGILNATPEEHRGVVEEAAGILKHRVRKEKALRRLERTDGDVVRLHDLLGELARQTRPLKRQAEAAARHQALADEVRALHLFLGGEELREVRLRSEEATAEEAALVGTLEAADRELSELVRRIERLRPEAARVRSLLDGDSASAASLETTTERLRRIVQVAHERHRAGVARIEGADDRRRDLLAEAEDLRAGLTEVEREEAAVRKAAESAERAFRAWEDEERSLADQEAMPAEGAAVVARGELRALDAAGERDGRELASVERRLEAIAGQRESEADEIDRINEEIRAVDAEASRAQSRYEAAGERRRSDQEAWERADEERRAALVTVTAAEARLEALEQAAAGLADPAGRSLVERSEGALGSVTARLDVPAGLASAVDAALGSFSDGVVFSDAGRLADAVGSLKGSGRGGVPLVHPGLPADAATARRVAEEWGLEVLVDLLGADADRVLAAALLGDVVVAEGWQTAMRIVERHPELRVVTPEGDVVARSGIRVSLPDGATPAMIETAAAELEAARTELARKDSILTQSRRVFETARREEREALEALEALEARLAGASEALARMRRSVHALDDHAAALAQRRQALIEAGEEREGQRRLVADRLAALEGVEAERQRAWEELARRRREVAAEREAARAAWQEAESALRAAVERKAMLSTRLAAVEAALGAGGEGEGRPHRLEALARIEAIGRSSLDRIRPHVEALRTRQARLREEESALRGELHRAERERDDLAASLERGRERLGSLRVERVELRAREEAIAERLRRDADASEEEALAAARPEGEDLAHRLEVRQAELRRMGPVNPLAEAEYAELRERHEFLSGQLADLERSRDELRKVIGALDDEIRQRFLQAFEEIAAAYERTFAAVFPGGRGRLRLTDPDDPLTSGVEIEAQPVGKRIARMSLLSGGERSLAALAFLFAVFESRPSPFYILDEVEAALDDANLRRFLRLLESFRDRAQLVVVTHQQQTMEVADVLYGVTMEPGGSSRVVAKVLSGAGQGAPAGPPPDRAGTA